ncbi:MAG TPA: addiction module toxin RelE [Cyanobacteria bacterium UBA11149]|nr:addiction module toxin RelE [Cyanobacteria bacterium UBA11367]HBE61037.1 addiction module toxin RelE [Cyanobacteria bacterium UBA11366]HBK65743.1 addiction module toxin RelE [Cyanobacteria bacterium UBA11166]HBR72496.1 addiction module toxin RelE [Cyanobacteria bacterium UBA11159]HBS70991.1 addiction module toxin RelE [Cyanobacteria bacterium UBA11153]HBW90859.1 addiction module toxin RelE [Cyanobacteria bacterium UBA11149]HCA95231.1 addiction module toxin RelE [Cyanobacteria bacterium UBA
MTNEGIKTVIWINSAKEELLEFPEEVIDEIGYILYRIQVNQTHPKVKPLKGFNGVFEIRNNYQTDTYRTVYAIKIDDAVYVLHAFKKKSPKGLKTPQQTIDLIRQRLQIATQISQFRQDKSL